jgi:hypothetical protein
VSSAALEERAQDRLQAQRACGFRCSTRIAKSLMPVDNERKHGGVDRFAAAWQGYNLKRKGKVGQLKLCDF